MKYFLVILISSCICCGCYSRLPYYQEHFAIEGRITHQNNVKLEKEGLICFGLGGSCRNTIRWISADYCTRTHSFTSIDEARIFLVCLIEDFVKPYNEEKRIRPYLHNFPFSAKNLEISINFQDKNGATRLDPFLSEIACYKGKMLYYKENPQTHRNVVVGSETYDRAFSIYQAELNKK